MAALDPAGSPNERREEEEDECLTCEEVAAEAEVFSNPDKGAVLGLLCVMLDDPDDDDAEKPSAGFLASPRLLFVR